MKYSGNATDNDTVLYGLNSAPDMVVVKCTSHSGSWWTYHKGLSSDSNVWLDGTSEERHTSTIWGGEVAAPDYNFLKFLRGTGDSSTPVYINVNDNGKDYIAYCWHSVLKVILSLGIITETDVQMVLFVYTGFKPAFVMMRRTELQIGLCLIM